jgi:ADP-heptose:LPS heptosyltransferase
MDTGPAHIAAAVGGTVFVICGNGDRGIFFPYPREQGEGENVFSILPPDLGCSRCRNLDAECLQLPTFRCISAVSPSQVFNVVNEFLRSLKKC